MTTSEDFAVESALQKSKRTLTAREYIANYFQRVRSGDLGSLPIIVGLIIIAIIFQSANSNFLTPRNLVNLFVQMSIFTVIGYGIVFVLLLGEIDLSVGYVAGVSAVVTGQLLARPILIPAELQGLADLLNGGSLTYEVPWFLAVACSLGVATLIGLLQGGLITLFQLPSFIVTVGGQLAWNGVVLLLMGGAGTVNMRNPTIRGITQSFFPAEWGYALGAIVVSVYLLFEAYQYRSRSRAGLSVKPVSIIALQGLVLGIMVFAFIYICNQDRGLPFVGVLVLVLMAVLTYLTTQTKFGRYLFAVGGNREAARRAGISVERIRLMGFVMCSLLAGMGGLILVSRLGSVAPDAGGGQLLLNSLAAPVIGGTSLYGGSGRISSAFFGALVIAAVDNGMFLLGLGAGQRLILTAIVLIAAVIVDALSRRTRERSGIR
jgi:D-xylose transport system permease protein